MQHVVKKWTNKTCQCECKNYRTCENVFIDFDLDNVLIDEKSYENVLIYEISNKTLIFPKALRIRYDKVDGIIKIYDGTRYSTLFGTKNMTILTA